MQCLRRAVRSLRLGLTAIARWEKFRFNPPPSRQQLEAVAKVLGVDADRLEQILPPAAVEGNAGVSVS
ncbi:hypothetical protein ACSQ6I_14920 [Anabaena sp. WFMT]|uniref:hypothetical protein n=1 Tax=Anabaena sp. WFMT TaxID=3449730 RepID=UPI003F1E4FFA